MEQKKKKAKNGYSELIEQYIELIKEHDFHPHILGLRVKYIRTLYFTLVTALATFILTKLGIEGAFLHSSPTEKPCNIQEKDSTITFSSDRTSLDDFG